MIMMDLMSVRFGMIVTRLVQGLMKAQEHAFGIGQDVGIPEAEDFVSQRFKLASAVSVATVSPSMLPTVDFDEQPPPQAGEVGDEWPNRHLLPKMMAVDLSPTEKRPEFYLSVGLLFPESSGTLQCRWFSAELVSGSRPPP
jgi:hypothetical protein